MNHPIIIFGASSAIARAAAGVWSQKGYPLCLAGRDLEDLDRIASDLKIRYPSPVSVLRFDAEEKSTHTAFMESFIREVGPISGILLSFGYLGDQHIAQTDTAECLRILQSNYVGAVSILNQVANVLERQGHGFIVGISSVAGDRGRQSNYLYGSAKAGLNTYLQGLRNRLAKKNVHVLTVKPGFVDTAMTFGLPKLFLVASPENAGRAIVRAQEAKRDVIYFPWFWRWIMTIIKAIPERIFKKLSL